MVDVTAEIAFNKQVAPGYHVVAFYAPEIASAAQPGQFVHVRVAEAVEPLLRVPLGVHDVTDDGKVLVLVKVVGSRTAALATKPTGDVADVLGPLGVPFSSGLPHETIALVGGGAGLAPLLFFAKRLRMSNRRGRLVIFAGLRTADHLPIARPLEPLGDEFIVTTDDGSIGRSGFVSEALAEHLERERVDRITACGPLPMLRAVAQIARQADIPCQVSFERRMGCGVGVCLGCVVPVWINDEREWEYVRSCIEGPTFDARDIVWEEISE